MAQTRSPISGRTLGRITRTADRLGPWLAGAAVALASLAALESHIPQLFPAAGRHAGAGFQVLVVAFCLASGVAAGFARRVRWPLYAVASVGWIWLALWPAVIVAAYFAGVTLRRWTHVLAFGAAALAVTGVSVAVSNALGGVRAITTGTFPNVAILLAGLAGLPLATGLWVSARRQAIAALRDRAARLEREQHARAEQARAQERTRIAREMHDVVAHRVSLMVLHAGALEVGAAGPEAAEAGALIRGIGREALTDLRGVLGVLREPDGDAPAPDDAPVPQPTLADLDRLLDRTRELGIHVGHRREGAPRPLPAIVERTAYRIVQEALTNVHKHAGDASADVLLRYRAADLEIEVRNGPGAHSPVRLPGGGLGLAGLRERVGLLGGAFTAGPGADGGFTLRAVLPDSEPGEGNE